MVFSRILWWLERFYYIIIVALLVLPARGAIQFEKSEIRLESKWEENEVSAILHFRNAGNESVRITDVRSSCGCTTTEFKKFVWAPGEKGEMKVKVDVRDQTGERLTVVTIKDDASSSPNTINVVTISPQPILLSSRILFWERAAPADSKSVTIRKADWADVQLTDLRSKGDTFKVSLDSTNDPAIFVLVIQPRSTALPVRTAVQFDAHVRGRVLSFLVYAAVE